MRVNYVKLNTARRLMKILAPIYTTMLISLSEQNYFFFGK